MAKHLAQQIGVAVDVVVFTVAAGRLSVLLTAVKRPPYAGKWALPGGLIGARETLDHAAAREVDRRFVSAVVDRDLGPLPHLDQGPIR